MRKMCLHRNSHRLDPSTSHGSALTTLSGHVQSFIRRRRESACLVWQLMIAGNKIIGRFTAVESWEEKGKIKNCESPWCVFIAASAMVKYELSLSELLERFGSKQLLFCPWNDAGWISLALHGFHRLAVMNCLCDDFFKSKDHCSWRLFSENWTLRSTALREEHLLRKSGYLRR